MRIPIVTLLLMAALFSAFAQDRRDESPRRSGDRWGAHGGSWRRGFRDGATSGALAQLKAAMQAELKKIPLLDDKFSRLLNLQQERGNLHRRRFQIAQRGPGGTDAAMHQFHQLLQEEEKLNREQEELIQEFRRDAAPIQKHITQRREEVQKQIDQARSAGESERSKVLERVDRFYDNVDEKLSMLLEDPEAGGEWLRRFSRGFSPGNEEVDPRMVNQLRQRLDQLQQDQDLVHRQVLQMNEQIEEIREILDSAAPRFPKPRGTEDRRQLPHPPPHGGDPSPPAGPFPGNRR